MIIKDSSQKTYKKVRSLLRNTYRQTFGNQTTVSESINIYGFQKASYIGVEWNRYVCEKYFAEKYLRTHLLSKATHVYFTLHDILKLIPKTIPYRGDILRLRITGYQCCYVSKNNKIEGDGFMIDGSIHKNYRQFLGALLNLSRIGERYV